MSFACCRRNTRESSKPRSIRVTSRRPLLAARRPGFQTSSCSRRTRIAGCWGSSKWRPRSRSITSRPCRSGAPSRGCVSRSTCMCLPARWTAPVVCAPTCRSRLPSCGVTALLATRFASRWYIASNQPEPKVAARPAKAAAPRPAASRSRSAVAARRPASTAATRRKPAAAVKAKSAPARRGAAKAAAKPASRSTRTQKRR